MDGGEYAYVIHEGGTASAPPHRTRERGQRLGEWSPDSTGSAAGQASRSGGAPAQSASATSQTDGMRAITAGLPVAGTSVPAASARPNSVPPMDPEQIYGPDDPAYGPTPGWHRRDDDEEYAPPADEGPDTTDKAAKAANTAKTNKVDPVAPREPVAMRDPFEPLRPGDRLTTGQPPPDLWTPDQENADDPEHDVAGHEPSTGPLPAVDPDAPESQPTEEPDEPDVLEFGPPSDPEAGTLGDLRDLYHTAENIDPARLDRHFDQLLERQRRLISEYFEEAGSLGGGTGAPAMPFGFDTAESLASLRGDLRGEPGIPAGPLTAARPSSSRGPW
jgi:hypothetical protein